MDANMKNDLYEYSLRLADSALTMGQRLAEWCGHGPYLEEDVALTNVSLDMIGHAQLFYQLAVDNAPEETTADDLAFLRDAHEYRNPILTELPRGDFAYTTLKQYFVDVFNQQLYQGLLQSNDGNLVQIAKKAGLEVKYHLDRSESWCKRLALSTPEAKEKMQDALDQLWFYTPELFESSEVLERLQQSGVVPDYAAMKAAWQNHVESFLVACELELPKHGWQATGGWQGEHSEHLGYMLAEMQFLPRAYPGCEW